MKLLLESDYAIRIILTLYRENKKKKALEILAECGIPPKIGQRIITKLVKANILYSNRGLNGGIEVVRESKDLSLYDVISVTQNIQIRKCIEGEENCKWDCQTCPLGKIMLKLEYDIIEKLEEINFSQLI